MSVNTEWKENRIASAHRGKPNGYNRNAQRFCSDWGHSVSAGLLCAFTLQRVSHTRRTSFHPAE